MHIVQIHFEKVPVKFYGGMERVIEALASGLLELGHQVTLISYKGDYSIPGVRHLYLDHWSRAQATKKFVGLIPSSADLVHFHLPFNFSDFPFPYLATMHGNLDANEKNEQLPQNLVFLSADHARRHGRRDFIFNGLDPKSIPMGYTDLRDRQYFAFLGRARLKRKGLQLAKSLSRRLETPLSIGGGRGISWGKIRYHGHLDNTQKFQLFADAKALLFPILWDEPFGLVMIEAMFCGTPVFALQRGSVAEVLGQRGAESIFLTAHHVDELYQKILDYPWSAQPGEIRHYAQEHFSNLRMCQNYLDYYQRVLGA